MENNAFIFKKKHNRYLNCSITVLVARIILVILFRNKASYPYCKYRYSSNINYWKEKTVSVNLWNKNKTKIKSRINPFFLKKVKNGYARSYNTHFLERRCLSIEDMTSFDTVILSLEDNLIKIIQSQMHHCHTESHEKSMLVKNSLALTVKTK